MDFIIKPDTQWNQTKTGCLVVPVMDQQGLSEPLKLLDETLSGLISRLNKAGDIDKSNGQCTLLHCPESAPFSRLLLVGAGKEMNRAGFLKFTDAYLKQLKQIPAANVAVVLSELQVANAAEAQLVQLSCKLAEANSYQYDETLSKKAKAGKLKKLTLICEKSNSANKDAAAQGKAMAQGINTARHLGNLPGNICTPSYLARQAEKLAKNYTSISTKVLDEAQLKKLKMNAMLSVTAGTEQPAKFIIMEYKGGKSDDKPYVLVGKGVTFDSGGISLKPGAKMDEMKFDMCGAASVFGTLTAVAELGLKLNIVGVIGAVENLPSGKATKPGDVITSMSGQTIEVLNTDAEGRLVLCDALTYVERFKPKAVVDIATLTGACVVALGTHASGLYSNNDTLSQQLREAGESTYDRAWPMPLWEEYDQQLKSPFADMGNIGGPEGGSVTAACFLARFTKKYDWAHLDIAGAAWNSGANKGATGRPVSLLTQYLINQQ